jgi:hypothetical protein
MNEADQSALGWLMFLVARPVTVGGKLLGELAAKTVGSGHSLAGNALQALVMLAGR